MAQYTVQTNAKQEKALDFVLNRANAMIAAQVPPGTPITRNDYVQAEFTDHAQRWVAERKDNDRSIVDRYADASDAKRAQVDAILA